MADIYVCPNEKCPHRKIGEAFYGEGPYDCPECGTPLVEERVPVKWVIIHTNLAQNPMEPVIEFYTTDSVKQLMEHLDEIELNVMNVTAIPLAALQRALQVEVNKSWIYL